MESRGLDRFRLLVREPEDYDGRTIYTSDDIEDIDEAIEDIKHEVSAGWWPEGTMVYAVAGPRRDSPIYDKEGVGRPRTRRELGRTVIMRSRVYQVEGGNLVKSGWVSTRK